MFSSNIGPTDLIIPTIYKDYGRARGCKESAEWFMYLINEILTSNATEIINKHLRKSGVARFHREHDIRSFFKFEMKNSQKLLEDYISMVKQLKNVQKRLLYNYDVNVRAYSYEVSEFRYTNFAHTNKENILFQMNMIQNPSHRGYSEVTRKPNDIVFCKGLASDNQNDVVQNILAQRLTKFNLFPKYMSGKFNRGLNQIKFQNMYEKIARALRKSKKLSTSEVFNESARFETIMTYPPTDELDRIKLRISFYNREDSCPVQTDKYRKYIRRLEEDPQLNKVFELVINEFGYNNNLDLYELCNELNTTDILLYARPTHRDIYPNTVLDAISRGCLILDIDKTEDISFGPPDPVSGIEEIKEMFPYMFLDPKYGPEGIILWYMGNLFNKNYMKRSTMIKQSIQSTMVSLELVTYIFMVNKLLEELEKYEEKLKRIVNGK